jgi:hypothetical protein
MIADMLRAGSDNLEIVAGLITIIYMIRLLMSPSSYEEVSSVYKKPVYRKPSVAMNVSPR